MAVRPAPPGRVAGHPRRRGEGGRPPSTADAVLLQLQQPADALLAAATAARGTVILDGVPPDDALLPHADVIRADEHEATLLSAAGDTARDDTDGDTAGTGDKPGNTDTDAGAGDDSGGVARGLRMAARLHARGPWLAVLALADGANLFAWSARSPWGTAGHLVIPGVRTARVDTTGAGDAMVAGLTAGLLRGDGPAEVAAGAVAAAAATLGHPGGRPDLTPERLAEQRRLIDSATKNPIHPE